MSETDFLKLKKHDNVETNTEKFDIENYLNGNWDKIDENVGEFNTEISNINSKNTELEKELKEAQEDFYQNSIRGQASGEYIHVEDSSNCRAKIGIGGNSEQETSTQGKNYFTGNKIDGGTNLEVTYSFDNSILRLNGTMTNSGSIILDKPTKVKLPAGTYTYTIKVKSGTFKKPSGDFAVYIMSASNTFITGDYANSGITGNELTQKKGTVSHIFNLTEEKEIYLRCFTSNANIVFNNLELEIQIESGSVYTEFEQFVPNMPSPDYPSKIKTVGSNINLIEETFKGYNLNANGAFEVSSSFNMQIAKVKANVIYTLNTKTNVLGYYNEKPTLTSVTYNKSRTVLSGDTNTIVATRDGYIAIRTMDAAKVKLVEGTEVGEYSKYGQGCITEFICNENYSNVNFEQGAISANVGLDYGSVKTNNNSRIRTVDLIKLDKTKKYTIIFNKKYNVVIQAFNDNKQLYSAEDNTANVWHLESFSFSGYPYIAIAVKNNGNTSVITPKEIENVNLILSDKIQTYTIPTQQEMLEGDYFDWDNEEEVHIFGKKVLTGNENWEAIGTNTSGKYRFQTKVDDIAFNADGDTYLEGICDSYKVGTPNTTYLCQESIATVQYYLIIYNEKVNDTVENFKKGLSNKNVTIYYKLATPTRLPFTDEQKAVAKELNNARTYKNVTNITTDSIAILDLDYAKDLETLLNNTQALAVNNASEGV